MTLSYQNTQQNTRLHIKSNPGNKPQKKPQLEVRFFSKQVVVAVAIYPEAKVIRNFPHNVHLIAVDGKGTKHPEDFFVLDSRGKLIGFIFKLSEKLFLGLYLHKRDEGTSKFYQSQSSLILLTFSSSLRTNEEPKKASRDHRHFKNLSTLLKLASEKFRVQIESCNPGMYFPLINELRSQTTELALSLVSPAEKSKPASNSMPLKGREISSNASLESLVRLANLLQISHDLLKQLSQSSQGNGVVLPHSSVERGKSNPSRGRQPKKDKGKYPVESRADETKAERNRREHLIKDIKRVSNELVRQLKQLKRVKRLKPKRQLKPETISKKVATQF